MPRSRLAMTERGDSGRGSGSCRSGPAGPTPTRVGAASGALRRDDICRGSVRCARGDDDHHHDAPRGRAADRARARRPDPGHRSGRARRCGRSSGASRRSATRWASSAPRPRRSAIIVAAVWIGRWWAYLLAFLLGRAHAQLAALMHEAAHRLLFRNRRPTTGSVVGCSATRPSRHRRVPPGPHGAPPRGVRPEEPDMPSTSATPSRPTRCAASCA